MGLDMYLFKAKRIKDMTIDEVLATSDYIKANELGYEKFEDFSNKNYSNVRFDKLDEVREFYDEMIYGDEVAYWRKANQIHNWFVNNVQNKNDDCGTYIVSEQKLTDLLNTCKLVSMSCNLIKGEVERGQELKDGKFVPILSDGMVIEDKTVAENLLPTQDGFFFGSTQYDEWYLEAIQNTINQIEQILDTTDFDTECILYYASW